MSVLKKYNTQTLQWEPVVVGSRGATGQTGAAGAAGATGPGVPAGGSATDILQKNSGTDYDCTWLTRSTLAQDAAFLSRYVALTGISTGVPTIQSSAAGSSALTLVGNIGQTYNLQEWKSATGTVLAAMGPNGTAIIGGQYPGGQFDVFSTWPTNKVLRVKAYAAQSANLTEWLDSASAVLCSIGPSGIASFAAGMTAATVSATRAAFGTASVPASNVGQVLIQPQATGNYGLAVKGMAGQTADLQQWQDSTPTTLTRVDAYGRVGIRTSAGMSSSVLAVAPDQASSLGLVIRGIASQAGDLTQWQDSAGTVLTSILAGGHIYANSANIYAGPATAITGTKVAVNTGSSGTKGLIIQAAGSQTANLIEFWNSSSTVIGKVDASAAAQFVRLGIGLSPQAYGLHVATPASTERGIVVKGAVAQTANLTEWRNSADTLTAYVSASGQGAFSDLTAPVMILSGGEYRSKINQRSIYTGEGSISTQYTTLAPPAGIQVFFEPYATTTKVLVVKGVAAQTGDLQQWQDSAGTVLAYFDATGHLKTNGTKQAQFTYFTAQDNTGAYLQMDNSGGITVVNRVTGVSPLTVKAVASQTAHLQKWQSSAGGNLAYMDIYGGLYAAGLGSVNQDGSWIVANNAGPIQVNAGAGGAIKGLLVKGAASQTANLQEWQDSAASVLASVNTNGTGTFNGGVVAGGYAGGSIRLSVMTNSAGVIGAVVKGYTAQTANLQEWQNSSGTVQAAIAPDGRIDTLWSIRLGSTSAAMSGGPLIYFINATAPSANPVNGGYLYAEGGALKYRGSSGTITTIAPA